MCRAHWRLTTDVKNESQHLQPASRSTYLPCSLMHLSWYSKTSVKNNHAKRTCDLWCQGSNRSICPLCTCHKSLDQIEQWMMIGAKAGGRSYMRYISFLKHANCRSIQRQRWYIPGHIEESGDEILMGNLRKLRHVQLLKTAVWRGTEMWPS